MEDKRLAAVLKQHILGVVKECGYSRPKAAQVSRRMTWSDTEMLEGQELGSREAVSEANRK